LRLVEPKQDEVFFDLGCGTGLPSAVAAVMFPELAASEGAEFLEQLVRIGTDACSEITADCRKQGLQVAPISL